MPDVSDPIALLIKAHQLYTARKRVESIKAGNPRVWGLDQQLVQIQSAIAKVERLVAEGDSALSSGEPRMAYGCYSKASALAADHPDLAGKLDALKKQLWEAKGCFEQALAKYRQDEWQSARELVAKSLSLNPQSKSAKRLHAELMQSLSSEARDRRQIRWVLAIGGGIIAAIILIAGAIAYRQFTPPIPDTMPAAASTTLLAKTITPVPATQPVMNQPLVLSPSLLTPATQPATTQSVSHGVPTVNTGAINRNDDNSANDR